MNISLTEEQHALVQRLVKSGRYRSESEALSEALKLLEEDARFLEEVRRDIGESIQGADRGEAVPFDQALVDRIKAEGREALAQSRRNV